MFDSSQEGTQALNTTFNGFDDTIKAPAIQAIQVAIQSIEEQVSSITGVLTQALGNIQQRDAVSNVKVGVRQSTLLTKQYFSAMDLMYKEVNYALKKKKAENDQLGQMQQQLQQYEQQMKDAQQQIQQLSQENKNLQNKLETNNAEKLKLDAKRVDIEDQTRQDKANYNEDLIDLKKRQLEVERLQILDGNPYNDKVRDV